MKRLGPYELREELARGAMGVVFRAHDPALDRELALKIVGLEELRSEDGQERFLREVRTMARLRHRHVIAVHAAGLSSQGYPYLAMDLIEGGSLKDRLTSAGRLPIREAVRYAIQVASALEYAHARGILHRDIKPHNILLDGEDALLTDFGLAKWVGADAQGLTLSGERIGTPIYMAPEQALGDNHRVGPATDIYAVGATLFHLLTGVHPFKGTSALELFANIVHEPPNDLRKARPEVDASLDAIVSRCLAKEPKDRFPSAGSLRSALEDWERGADDKGPLAATNPADRALRPLPRTRRRAAWIAGGVGVLLLGLGVGLVSSAPLERSLRRDVWSEELPEALNLLSVRGGEREGRDDFEGAIEDYSAVIAGEPDCSAAWFKRGRAKRGLDDVAGAIADLDEAIRIDPEFAMAFNLRGLAKFSDDPEGALADMTRSIVIDPSMATYYVNRSGLHYKNERYDEALTDAERALDLDPRYAQAYYMRGMIRKRTEGDAAALADWDRAIAFEPHATDPRSARGALRSKQGDHEGAIEDFTAAVVALLESPSYHYERALAHEALSNWEAALADLNTAIQIDPTHTMAHAHRAKLFLRFHRYDEAVADYETAGNNEELEADAREILLSSARRVREGLAQARYSADDGGLTLREGPGVEFRVIADLGKGAVMRMLGERQGKWAKVEIQDQGGNTHTGWVDATSLSLVIQ